MGVSLAEFTYDSADKDGMSLPRGMNEIISRGCVRRLTRLGYKREAGMDGRRKGPPRSQANSQIYILGGAGSAKPSAPYPLWATQIHPPHPPPHPRPPSPPHPKP